MARFLIDANLPRRLAELREFLIRVWPEVQDAALKHKLLVVRSDSIVGIV